MPGQFLGDTARCERFLRINEDIGLIDAPWLLLLFPFGALSALGAGIGAFLQRPLIGAGLGFVLAMVLCCGAVPFIPPI